MPTRTGAPVPQKAPVSGSIGKTTITARDPFDVVGRFNDLINGYILYGQKELALYGPLVLIGVLLVIVMLFALYQIIKD